MKGFARGKQRLLGATLAGALLLVLPAAASATDFPVTNNSDSGAGSLRQAITDANAHGGSDSITISPVGTLTLLSALPTINDDVTITGPGQSQFTVNGADTYQGLRIQSGTVSISGLTITHGKCDSAGCNFTGGGLYNAVGTVTLTDVAITSSTTTGQGGGIYNSGTMSLSGSDVSSNTSATSGGTNAFAQAGGIFNAGTLSLTNSTVSGNTASGAGASGQNAPEGGGIFNNAVGTVNITTSTIDSNNVIADAQAAGGTANAPGGGIDNSGTLHLVRSTISNNVASAVNGSLGNNAATGAGVANGGNAVMTADRSTVSNNSVIAADQSSGGGIQVSGTSFIINSSTIAHNSATTGANLALQHAITLRNTIVSSPSGGTDCSATGFTASQGYNLADDASCELEDATDQESTNPMLAASLANNGGPTRTYALQTGSPAIDQGKSDIGEIVDQRGDTRPSDFGNIPNASGGDGSDIGAFEVQDTAPPDTSITAGPTSGSTINDPTPTFGFTSTELGSVFQCKIDYGFGASFTPNCTSPRTTGHLDDGSHTFGVRARDLAGNVDPSAATRSFTVKTAAISRSGSTLVITAAPGAKDNIQITRPSASTIRISDAPAGAYTGSGVHTVGGSGCVRSGDYTANCTAVGVTAIKANGGALTDKVVNGTGVPSTLVGGAANDVLIGGSANDVLNGGPAADTFKGMNGNDTLLAHDSASDMLINCDGGTTPGAADKADLDLLPNDPNAIVLGCETKTRH